MEIVKSKIGVLLAKATQIFKIFGSCSKVELVQDIGFLVYLYKCYKSNSGISYNGLLKSVSVLEVVKVLTNLLQGRYRSVLVHTVPLVLIGSLYAWLWHSKISPDTWFVKNVLHPYYAFVGYKMTPLSSIVHEDVTYLNLNVVDVLARDDEHHVIPGQNSDRTERYNEAINVISVSKPVNAQMHFGYPYYVCHNDVPFMNDPSYYFHDTYSFLWGDEIVVPDNDVRSPENTRSSLSARNTSIYPCRVHVARVDNEGLVMEEYDAFRGVVSLILYNELCTNNSIVYNFDNLGPVFMASLQERARMSSHINIPAGISDTVKQDTVSLAYLVCSLKKNEHTSDFLSAYQCTGYQELQDQEAYVYRAIGVMLATNVILIDSALASFLQVLPLLLHW